MHALVTGAGGFLGRYIVEQLLARGDRCAGWSGATAPSWRRSGVELVAATCATCRPGRRACTGVDVVFHVAGVAGIWGPWEHYYSINTVGTQNVIAAAGGRASAELVYTSSPSVTFDGRDQRGVDEAGPYARRWLCHYPHSKALAEQAVLAANGPGLATLRLRPHLIWGPRDQHLVPRLLDRARAGRLRRVGDGTNRIDMVYVENAAAAHLLAADALRRLAGRWPGLFHQPGRAGELLGMDRRACWRLAGLPPVGRSIAFAAAWRLGAVSKRSTRCYASAASRR